MTTKPRSESLVIQFLDNFLQEKNIKWVLTAGMLILLGSSLMMVMPNWNDFEPTWKFLTILAYTGAIFGAGSVSYHQLALRKTGTGLYALTVVMVPISCLAWNWLWGSVDSPARIAFAGLMFGLNAVVATVISRRTFRHFLRADAPTFLASYLVLSLAGGLAPAIRDAGAVWSSAAALALWGVFAVGVTKVNRHVFWLTEEHRAPRIFGFFPIVLLGGQFLLIFLTNFAESMTLDWIGFGCVLVAIPVLLTADTVARVFQERTGDLVRPIPWPILLPFGTGLLLCVVGLGLSVAEITQRATYAAVPAAALSACMMAVVARRTHKAAFVWAMLAGIVIAYNFSPVFFQNAARALISEGAAAVRESRLPYAFYGLTYLPLIVAMAAAAALLERRSRFARYARGEKLEVPHANPLIFDRYRFFAEPIKQFTVGISLVLLIAAMGHEKAHFPVAAVMMGVFACLAPLFQNRHLATPGVVAYLIALFGAVPFFQKTYDLNLPADAFYLVPLAGAAVLLAISSFLDPRIGRLPNTFLKMSVARLTATEIEFTLCRTCSLLATLGITAAVSLRAIATLPPSPLVAALVVGLLFFHSLVWVRPALSWFVYIVGMVELVRFGMDQHLGMGQIATFATLVLFLQWIASYVFARFPNARFCRSWSQVNLHSAWLGLSVVTLLIALPEMVQTIRDGESNLLAIGRNVGLVVWCFDAARRSRNFSTLFSLPSVDENRPSWIAPVQSAFSVLGCICTLGVVSANLVAELGTTAQPWIAVACAVTATIGLAVVEATRPRVPQPSQRAIRAPVEWMSYGVLGLLAAWQLIEYSLPMRIAGYLAIGSLVGMSIRRRHVCVGSATAALVNWTILVAAMQRFVPESNTLFALLRSDLGLAPWCVTALAALSVLVWRHWTNRPSQPMNSVALVQRLWLRIAVLISLAITLKAPALELPAICLAAICFAALTIGELWAACQYRDESRAWVAQGVGLAGIAYFFFFNLISLDHVAAMFVALGGGIACHVAARLTARWDSTAILSRPLRRTGLSLPLAAVAIGVYRHFSPGPDVTWLGLNSLAVLTSAALYFWHAIEFKSKRFAVLAAAIVNVALALLWQELRFNDPQFYMIPLGISILLLVEILRKEIPSNWHNPLRYAGALTILVSPTFHIVGGSWLHLYMLMIASTAVLLASIGLRIRALMYTGAAFLVADLIGMVVCGSIDHPNLLWIAGVGFGAAVVTLGAVCEHHREKLLQRMRMVSTQLEQWS